MVKHTVYLPPPWYRKYELVLYVGLALMVGTALGHSFAPRKVEVVEKPVVQLKKVPVLIGPAPAVHTPEQRRRARLEQVRRDWGIQGRLECQVNG